MIIKVAPYLDKTLDKKTFVITEVVKSINNVIGDQIYSNSVDILYLGVVCISDEFKQFFPHRKPKFNKKGKYLEFSVHLDFKIVSNMTNIEFEGLLLDSIINSLPIIRSMDDKFDIDELINDLNSTPLT